MADRVMGRILALLLVCQVAAGCGGDGPPAEPAAVAHATSSGIVDTVLPPDVALQRFREGLPAAPAALVGGASGIEPLVERWVRAVETHDTAAIRRLVLDRAEFAFLHYPETAFARRPLYQPPELLWFRLQAGSEKGIVRVLRRLGGQDAAYRGVECPRPARAEGPNRIWEYCEILREEAGAVRRDVLFGGILERDGRFKFISYTNQY